MTHALGSTVAFVAQTLGAFLFALLGIWVLTLDTGRRQTRLLGAFALLFGMGQGVRNLVVGFHVMDPTPAAVWILFPGYLLAYVAAVGLAASVPSPLRDRRLLAASAGVGLAFSLATVYVKRGFLLDQALPNDYVLFVPELALVGTATVTASVLLPLRARPGRGVDPEGVRQLALLAVALALLDAFGAGAAVPDAARPGGPGLLAFLGLYGSHTSGSVWLAVVGLWSWNMVRADRETIRVHRASALSILGLFLAGAVYQAAWPGIAPNTNAVRGVTRAMGVGLLAYGVLRHDLAGLDEKVEVGVSRTTVAGIFVAVFFVVSEGAQVLFAGFAGSEILGVLAAGALVFFLAPIQRAADELAEAVVPGGEPGSSQAPEAEVRYRREVEMALADGEITADEERRLAQRADALGLSHARERAIREQVADELEAGGDPA